MRFFRRRPVNNPSASSLDQQLVFQLSKSRIPSLRQIKYAGRYLTRAESWVLSLCAILVIGSLAFMGVNLYRSQIRLVPDQGGRYIEGSVGNPRYINPLYSSLNDVDNDLDNLIYSRLFSIGSDGKTIPDLVDRYELSSDRLTYTLHLKEARWADGSPVSADDVLFTFRLIQDPDYKSPLRNRFSGVVSDRIDDRTVAFGVREPFGRFPALLDFGIMPAAAWEGVSAETIPLAELNIKPIGSGPYRLKSLTKTKLGTINTYTLERNPNYYGQAPYLDEIIFKFFPSPEEMLGALNSGQLNGISYLSPENEATVIAKNALDYHAIVEPNLSAVFFNLKSKGVTSDVNVRKALSVVDRSAIITSTLGRAGIPASGPLAPNQEGFMDIPYADSTQAAAWLDTAGWKLRTITAAEVEAAKTDKNGTDIVAFGVGQWRFKDTSGLKIPLIAPKALSETAEALSKEWLKLGIKTEISIQEDATVRNDTLANKRYDVLLYTEAISDGDPYPFWRSGSPANLSGYNRSDVDTWLEEARLSGDQSQVADRYRRFQDAIKNDTPAVFLYWQAYLYPQTKKLEGFSQTFVTDPSQRLLGARNWYLETRHEFKK